MGKACDPSHPVKPSQVLRQETWKNKQENRDQWQAMSFKSCDQEDNRNLRFHHLEYTQEYDSRHDPVNKNLSIKRKLQ